MSIIYYGQGEHPGGFIGFRVNVSYADNYYQEYFSTSTARLQSEEDTFFLTQKLKAEHQEAEWRADSLMYQYKRYVTKNHPLTKPGRGVGVHGITASFFLDKSKKWQAAFVVAKCQAQSKRRVGPRQYHVRCFSATHS